MLFELLLLSVFFVLGLTIGGGFSFVARKVYRWRREARREEFNREITRIDKKYPGTRHP